MESYHAPELIIYHYTSRDISSPEIITRWLKIAPPTVLRLYLLHFIRDFFQVRNRKRGTTEFERANQLASLSGQRHATALFGERNRRTEYQKSLRHRPLLHLYVTDERRIWQRGTQHWRRENLYDMRHARRM